MTSIAGTYYNGQLTLEHPFRSDKPVRIRLIIEDESASSLKVSDFSFRESQEMLKNYTGSFSDEVIAERRKSV